MVILHVITKLRHGFFHLFYPRLCEGCYKPLVRNEDILCMHCLAQLPKTGNCLHHDNETTMRFAGRIDFSHAASFAYFSAHGMLQQLLHGLKYKGKKQVGSFLGTQFAFDLQQADWITTVDLIVPVPLHPKRQAKRGYNQSTIIAEAMGGILQIPYDDKLLLRKKNTESQTKKTREERALNMKEAFICGKPVSATHVLLLDDVLTTGATLEACANTIRAKDKNVQISIVTIGLAS